ncbi:unnamed protein product [Ilex paraguariensis]|uniref:WRKY domain-containing protein n=1 Tax=Ilex paraguariensis TaxID=185542 RepID=A0ABC8R5R9_9AQUA
MFQVPPNSVLNSPAMEHFQNPNPYPTGYHVSEFFDTSDFELSDYLVVGDGSEGGLLAAASDNVTEGSTEFGSSAPRTSNSINFRNGSKKNKVDGGGFRVAFRTKSDLEIMDDGFKWRKYGKKMVKNSPNPRNYYKCSSEECYVKKRVERDREDPSYVITTYDGVHNHESPSVVYYNQQPLMIPDGWTLQASSSLSSSS